MKKNKKLPLTDGQSVSSIFVSNTGVYLYKIKKDKVLFLNCEKTKRGLT